jgi:COP9 signalosome complex subunit 4
MSSDDAKASLSSGIASQNTLLCRNCIDAALSETVELGIAREFFRHLCSELESVPVESNNFVISVASDAVERIRSSFRAAYLDVADFSLRNILWSALSGEGEYERAATALSTSRALREEAGGSSVADELRAHAFVCIAQSYLHLGDEVSADSNIRRAGDIIESETTAVSWKVQLMYKTCVARILDSKRRFFEAAVRYAELSRLSEDQIDEMELIAMLEKAVDCILLAPINASRQRVMGSLMRDSRIARIKVRHMAAS